MIPLPGANFVYSLIKDLWSWLRVRSARGVSQSIVAHGKRWTVGHWYNPDEAIFEFGSQGALQSLREARTERDKAWNERDLFHIDDKRVVTFNPVATEETPEVREAKTRALCKRYDDAELAVDAFLNLIYQDLNDQLLRGELIARGFREPFSHGVPYRTISRHEWRILKLEPPDRATGGGVSYVGLTIGKAGTKSFFRRA
jgi:hypothetical protein